MKRHILTHLSRADAVLGGLIRAVGPCRLSTQADGHPFQILARAIAHQQLNGTAANTILKRLVDSCGAGLFPTPEQVLAASAASLRAAGFSFAKVAALRDLAEKAIAGVVPDAATLRELGDEEIIARLTQVRGIGRWTVEMLLVFHLGRPDVLPVDDFGVRSGFQAAYGLSRLPRPRALAAWGDATGVASTTRAASSRRADCAPTRAVAPVAIPSSTTMAVWPRTRNVASPRYSRCLRCASACWAATSRSM